MAYQITLSEQDYAALAAAAARSGTDPERLLHDMIQRLQPSSPGTDGSSLLRPPSLSSFPRISVFGPLGRYLRQIALIFYFEELSESSRKLDTNVFYLTHGDGFSE